MTDRKFTCTIIEKIIYPLLGLETSDKKLFNVKESKICICLRKYAFPCIIMSREKKDHWDNQDVILYKKFPSISLKMHVSMF